MHSLVGPLRCQNVTGASFARVAYFGAGEGQIVLDNVRCNGNETRLVDCSNEIPNCQHSEDVGVICQGEVHAQFLACLQSAALPNIDIFSCEEEGSSL